MPADLYRSPIPPQLWDAIREEFSLPKLDQVRQRLEAVSTDAEPTLRQLVRVFIDDGTFCPGFQFQRDLSLDPVVVRLFQRNRAALPAQLLRPVDDDPCHALDGARPADWRKEHGPAPLAALESTLARAVA